MGLSHDCASYFLFCSEDNNSVLGFEEEDDVNGEVEGQIPEQSSGFYGDFLMAFPLQSDECLSLLVQRESEHLPREDYAKRLLTGTLDISVRRDAIDWIGKVHAHYSFGPLTAYLSVNYLDRFLSNYELPQGKAWMTQLLSVACLYLAAKMEESEVPRSLDLQLVGESKCVFEAKTIQRMEVLVLSTLNWRMQSVTPFSFIDYFLHSFNSGDTPPKSSVIESLELILRTIRGIDFLEFRPSEVAAAVAFSVLGETQLVEIDKALSCCTFVEKERVLRCYEVIQEMIFMRNSPLKNASGTVLSVPKSPIGVLDAACLSYKSDDITVGSLANSHHSSPVAKRRKLNRPSMSWE